MNECIKEISHKQYQDRYDDRVNIFTGTLKISCQPQAREEADCAFDRRWWKTEAERQPTPSSHDQAYGLRVRRPRAEFEALVAMAYDNDELDMLKDVC
jgi:hypothetical protein